LPEYKGFSLDGAAASEFIDTVEDLFVLHQTPDSEKVVSASRAFPLQTPAKSWYKKAGDDGEFTDIDENGYSWALFKSAFSNYFKTPLAKRYQLEDSFDHFTQRETVKDHRVIFETLVYKLRELGIYHSHDVIASKYLRSLKPELFQAVCNRNNNLPEFNTIHEQAVETEYRLSKQSGPKQQKPDLRGIPSTSTPKNTGKYCVYHKATDHNTDDCPRVKELKEQGKWKGKKQ
jgi:hypothetical protein